MNPSSRNSIASGLQIFASVFQVGLAIILVAGDFGFDHPGRFGLSFEHFVVIGAAFVGTTGFMAVWTWIHARWTHCLWTIGLGCMVAAVVLYEAL